MVSTPTALVAAVVAVAATATAAAAAAVSPAADAAAAAEVGLTAASKVFTLTPDCGGDCQANVASSLTARGCTNVAVLPTLRLATAACEAAAAGGGRSGRRMESATAEKAALQSLPGVMSVEEDELVVGEEPVEMDSADAEVPLKLPNGEPYFWGLDRINQAALPLDENSNTSTCYPRRGAGVTVYVIDGGCAVDHPEFTPGQITSRALPSSPFDPAGKDEKGHGSHVAGTIGGRRTGVAPGVTLACIRVLSAKGSGKRSDVAAGWEAVAAAKAANPAMPTVLHASLSGSGTHHDAAMERLAALGVIPVVSAGNTGGDSCERTPARSPNAITVANADIDDTLHSSSSRGSCVDIIAPGQKILSVNFRGGLKTLTGTSMSAPHVSGIVALLLAERADGASLKVDAVKALLADGAPIVAGWPLGWAKPSCAAPPSPKATPAPSPKAPTPTPAATTPPPAATTAPTLPPPAATMAPPPPVATTAPSPTAATTPPPAATAAPPAGNFPWGIPPWLAGSAAPTPTPAGAGRWGTPPWLVV